MENEQMNQQPTYEQLAQAYTAILRENEQLKAALNSMLQSCAPGISVVNIDNGFGAAVYAITILKTFQEE